MQRVKHAGGTFSGKKIVCAAPEFTAVGNRCTRDGRVPEPSCVEAVTNWGPCKNLSEVRAFLGTVGVARIFIKDYAKIANPLNKLLRKGAQFEWGPDQERAMANLKQALLDSPALRPIDYESDAPVILAVDTSYIAVGFHLCQEDLNDPRKRYYSRFGSITLNEREARFSQPKLELYGLFRALRALRFYLVGVRNLRVEIDATAIKDMLENPHVAPSAVMNRWIIAIKMFHFELVHVPGKTHAPDGLSRRPAQPGDPQPDEDSDFEDWIDDLYGFMHFINPPPRLHDDQSEEPASSSSDYIESFFQQTSGTSAKLPEIEPLVYDMFPRTEPAKALDERVRKIDKFLETGEKPAMTQREADAFAKYAAQFFRRDGRLYRVDSTDHVRRVLDPEDRPRALVEMHDYLGHRGISATVSFLAERFWWPELKADVAWYVRSCHQCQIRQTTKVHIPPTVAYPAPPMVRVHVDTMDMPAAGKYKYFFHARCATTTWPEGRASTVQTAKAIGDWIYQDLLCRWGAVSEIISDNGGPFVAALEYLAKQYHVTHIRISGYNSQANGVVERPHFHIRDILFKACDGDASQWVSRVYSALWADRVTTRRRMGCSPYFAVTGMHPVLPLDIAEATYLMPAPKKMLSTTELITQRAIALQKRPEQLARLRSRVFQSRVRAAQLYEDTYARTTKDFDFKPGRLVLMRNTAVEKALNRKMRARYLGPLVVISRNRGGAYIVAELDGAVHDRPIAAFRLIPYLARKNPIRFSVEDLDISPERLAEMETVEETFENEGLDAEEALPDY